MIYEKKRYILLLIVSCFTLAHDNSKITPWTHLNFEKALEKEKHPEAMAITKRIISIDAEELFAFLKDLYDRFSNIEPSKELKIPKIIHQIWLDDEHSGTLPQEFVPYVKTCIEKHLGDDWQYKLWTDKDVENLNLYNREYYDTATNFGVKSDLLKWEIIYKFGGVYLDTDIECLKSLEILHYTYDFYVGIQPLETKYLQLGAGVFAARPGHPILKHCIETIKDDWSKKGTVNKTGPVHFTKSFYIRAGRSNIDIALPPQYFYPICNPPAFFRTPRATPEERARWSEEGAFTIHHWSMSWMPPEYRQSEFKTVNNYESCKNWNQ